MNRERIGKYRIVGELGHGTMGEVYKALDPVLNRHVALKVLPTHLAPDDETLKRFHREAQAAALLSHPNIVTVHDFGEEQGVLYMAMELLEGTDLRHSLDEGLLPGLDAKLDVVDQVLAALDYAHGKGVVHRDVKPANIHIAKDKRVRIMDFGLARVNTSEMTQDGIVLGTPNYMSPEQALGDKVDARTDIFSLGAVFYEMLTGHKPFEAETTPSVLYQVVHRPPPPVRRWTKDVPLPLVEVVDKALAKEKDKRFPSASAMRAALAAVRRVPGFTPPPLPGPPPRRENGPPPRLAPPRPDQSQRPRAPSASSPRVRSETSGSHPSSPVAASRAQGLPRWVPLLAAGLVVISAGGALIAVWTRGRPGPVARPSPAAAQVDALTQALVATQVQLAQRELEDKNYAAAAGQAESTLRLVAGHPEASRLLQEARARLAGVESAVAEGRRMLELGDTGGASRQLSKLLELDPRLPAAAELSAQLNAVFRTQAEAAAQSMRAARAAATGTATGGGFGAAEAQAREAQDLFERGEYADATRLFLEARDGFDRARRAGLAPSSPGPVTSPATQGTRTAAGPPAQGVGAPPAARGTVSTVPGPAATSVPTTQAPAPARHFVSGRTVVATREGAGIQGFDTQDVRTRTPPEFAGRLEFEVLPAGVRSGEPFVVRIRVVNEGKKTARLRGLGVAMTVDGARSIPPAKLLLREVAPQTVAPVVELSGTWAEPGSWSLEVTLTTDRGETVTNRLDWI